MEGTHFPCASLYTLPEQSEGATVTLNFGVALVKSLSANASEGWRAKHLRSKIFVIMCHSQCCKCCTDGRKSHTNWRQVECFAAVQAPTSHSRRPTSDEFPAPRPAAEMAEQPPPSPLQSAVHDAAEANGHAAAGQPGVQRLNAS